MGSLVPGGKKIDLMLIEEVATTVQEELSDPAVHRDLVNIDRSVSMVHKIWSILHGYPYKISHVEELLPADLSAR